MKRKSHTTIKRKSSGVTSLSHARAREHLRSNSKTYYEDSAYALMERKRTENMISIPLSYGTGSLKFPSLDNGVCLRKNGHEFEDDDFELEMEQLVASRGRYKRSVYDKRDGKERTRLQKHDDPVLQIPVNFRPDHARAFSRLDQMEVPDVREVVTDFCLQLLKCMEGMSPYETHAVVIHPESGNLHCHLIFSLIDAEGQLLHARGHVGRHGMKTAGMGLIGALRIEEQGLLPPDYGTHLKECLESRFSETEQPYDWLLSEQLDALVEVWSMQNRSRKVGDKTVREVFAEEREAWTAEVRERLDARFAPNRKAQEAIEALEKELAEQKLGNEESKRHLAELNRRNEESRRQIEKLLASIEEYLRSPAAQEAPKTQGYSKTAVIPGQKPPSPKPPSPREKLTAVAREARENFNGLGEQQVREKPPHDR